MSNTSSLHKSVLSVVNSLGENNNTQSSGESSKITQANDPDVTISSGIVSADYGTTLFADDANTMQRDTSHDMSVRNNLLNLMNPQSNNQDIIDFLKKPIVLTSGSFATTDTYNIFNSFPMPESAWSTSQGEIWVSKLKGNYGIRMDMKFKLVVNSNKFQQGRYCLGWIPMAGAQKGFANSRSALVAPELHAASLMQRTQIPHVEIDLSTGTTAELVIPFMSTKNFYPLSYMFNNPLSTLGVVALYPYSPLVSPTGSTVATYTLYVSFENVTLYGAVSPQSALNEKELGNKMDGPISKPLKCVSQAFNEFGKIPTLSAYAAPVAWVTDRLARSAKIFGFSKPSQGDNNSKIQILTNPNFTTIDGDSDARSLGVISKPAVQSIPGIAGTDYDEMDYSYFVSKYCYITQAQWTGNTIGGAASWTIQCGPIYSLPVSSPIATTNTYTPLSFLGLLHKYYRGSIRFKFKIVKTEYHSGRLQIAFNPTDDYATSGNEVYVNRIIVDIREHVEFEVVVPFISQYSYLPTNIPYGNINVSVVDSLVYPASVSSSVTLLVEASGAEDFEFAIPSSTSYAIQLVTPQSGMDADELFSTTIGETTIKASPTAFSSMAIGDKISSFRSLLKRFTPPLQDNIVPGTYPLDSGGEMTVVPDLIPIRSMTSISAPATTNSDRLPDQMALVASCFAMWRGGIKVKDIIDYGLINSASPTVANALYAPFKAVLYTNPSGGANTMTSSFAAGLGSLGTNSAIVVQDTRQNNGITVEIPQYTQANARAKFDLLSSTGQVGTLAYTYSGSTTGVIVQFGCPAAISTNLLASGINNNYTLHNIFRAMADDGELLGFISIPPLSVVGIANQDYTLY